LTFNPRYPWHFCGTCLDRTADVEGRRLVFGNLSLSGGLAWAWADDLEHRSKEVPGVVCLIDARPVIVSEARFGGVVAEPLTAGMRTGNAVDLASKGGLAKVRASMRIAGKGVH
jgi:hypothetical protein